MACGCWCGWGGGGEVLKEKWPHTQSSCPIDNWKHLWVVYNCLYWVITPGVFSWWTLQQHPLECLFAWKRVMFEWNQAAGNPNVFLDKEILLFCIVVQRWYILTSAACWCFNFFRQNVYSFCKIVDFFPSLWVCLNDQWKWHVCKSKKRGWFCSCKSNPLFIWMLFFVCLFFCCRCFCLSLWPIFGTSFLSKSNINPQCMNRGHFNYLQCVT